MKVCFETFGCRLNRAEALEREAAYLAQGWTLTDRHSEADLFIVRGCSVTARAQRECERLIDHLRRHYPTRTVIVEGCLRDRTGEAPEAQKRLQPAPTAETPVPTRTARAYLKVQDGCSGVCAFCIVPSFRGPSVSVPFEDALDKARRFLDAGYRELVLTGCNLALYASGGKRLPELAAALADLAAAANARLRIGSVEPTDVARAFVSVMAEKESICRFLHLPVQSGSPRILAAMRRPYAIRDVERVIEEAVARLPRLGLGCDLMTGFPGETDFEFASTLTLLMRNPFSNAHVFSYSERPGTAAAKMPCAIPRDIRHQRARVLSRAAEEARLRYATRFIDQTVGVILENEKDFTGWTGEYFPCKIRGLSARAPNAPRRKELVRVHIRQVSGDRLEGLPVAS